jgi:type III secretion protein T
MHDRELIEHAYAFLTALALVLPRILGMFIALPMFAQQALPGVVRPALAAGLGLILVPPLAAHLPTLSTGMLLGIAAKESFLGFALGYLMALPFWAFEAAAFFIDNQRGASIGATLDPLTGNDSSQLGEMFMQAFIVFVLTSGAFSMMISALYKSFTMWPVLEWMPVLPQWGASAWLGKLDTVTRGALLLSAPVIIAMFLAELGLAMVSRFVPQLQVFVLAMPIKSGLAFLVLVLYASTLFNDAGQALGHHWGEVLSFLAQVFGKPAAGSTP